MGLKSWWKKKCCRHIYKEVAVDYLKEFDHTYPLGPMVEIDKYRAYAVTQECIKCGYSYVFERNVKVYPWTPKLNIQICSKCGKKLPFLETDENNQYITCCGVMVNKLGQRMNEDIFD